MLAVLLPLLTHCGTTEEPSCPLADAGDPDRPRVVLLGHPMTATPGVDGTAVRALTLGRDVLPVDDGARLDVGFRVARLAFVPSGAFALALGEDGALASIAVTSAADLHVVGRVTLPDADPADLVIAPDGRTAWVVGSDVGESSGVSSVAIACDGTLGVDSAAFFPLRLADSLVLVGDGRRAVVLGGQTVFDPVDPADLRLLERTEGGWREVAQADVFHDFIDASRIGVSPDGHTVLVPNGSPFSSEGGQVAVVEVRDDGLVETQRLRDLPAAREALFAPDGATALVSVLDPGSVAVLSRVAAGDFTLARTLTGIGLAEQMATVTRGTHAGTVFVPSVDANGGPNLAVLRIGPGAGDATDVGQVELGAGAENIPGAVAVTP
jgi:hypothetical protein